MQGIAKTGGTIVGPIREDDSGQAKRGNGEPEEQTRGKDHFWGGGMLWEKRRLLRKKGGGRLA